MAERTLLRLVGGLLLGGLIVQQIANLDHPGLNEDNYQAVFQKYADSSAWIAVHFVQYAGVLLFLGGLLVLYRVLQQRGAVSMLAGFGAAAAIAAAAALGRTASRRRCRPEVCGQRVGQRLGS